MPFDRRIAVRLRADGMNVEGVYVPGPSTDYPMWAEERNSGSTDTLTEVGVVVTEIRTFTIRYRRDVDEHSIFNTFVVDALGQEWNCENKSVSDMRKRTIELQCIRVT